MHDSTARRNREVKRHRRCYFAVLLALGLLGAGCSSDPFGRSGSGSSSSSPSFGDRFSDLFRSKPAAQDQSPTTAAPIAPPQDFECPTVTIREGTSTFAMSAPGVESAAMGMRYQASFGQLARECQLVAPTLKMRVGIEGRIIVGPAGAPAQVELPVRLAVVHEGPEPKVITTKLIWVTVAIPSDQTYVSFSQIDEDLSFPMPQQRAELDSYVVYVGFDPAAVKVPERKPPAKKPAKPRR